MTTATQPFLTDQQITDFQRDGFLVVPQMYSAQETAQVSAWIDEFAALTPKFGEQMVYFEDSLLEKGKRVMSRIERFANFHKGLWDFCYSEKMLGASSQLLGDRALLFKEKVNFKLPGGGGFTPHQDIQPGWDDYAPYFISVLVTIDPSTPENGCIELAAAHHTRGLIGRKWKPLEGDELKGIEFQPCPMQPGDVALFDCFAPHQSKPNLTNKPRRNVYLTYNRASDGDHREKYYADKRKNYPPDNEREQGKIYTFKV